MSNFGIDLLLESQKIHIKSKNDILLICMHWMLCRNNLRNVGVGDDKIYNEEDRPSELLPELWNSDQTAYTLRYTIDKQIFILHGIVSSNTLVVNLLDTKTLKTACLVFDTDKIVKSTTGITLDDFVVDSANLIKRIGDEIISPILKKPESSSARTETEPPPVNPLLVQPPRQPSFSNPYGPGRHPFDPLRDIGRGDLDPLGRGGGMIFQPDMPFRPGGFGPLGPLPGPGFMGIPPGARYDPPNPLRRLDPDNDHFQPPGGNPPPGYDDMFM